jgi:argininosuccinate synthase
MKKKIVLAYSGGLDTTVIIPWLKEHYDCEIVAVCVDVGQDADWKTIKKRALDTGAVSCIVADVKKEYVENYIWPALKANALYEDKYLLGTATARPLIAKVLVETARKERARVVAHGATGKGNDQVRFELGIMALAPDLQIIAPWRIWKLQSREEEIRYLEERNIPVPMKKKESYSRDDNLWHISHEGLELEDPSNEPRLSNMLKMSVPPEKAPNRAEYVEIEFDKGIPIALNGKKLDGVSLIKALNALGGRHGVGIADIVENRVVGMKSRGIYETPGGAILYYAHQELEHICLDRQTYAYKQLIAQKMGEIIYGGLWETPLREALSAFVDSTQKTVCGHVKVKLFKGGIYSAGVSSPYSLYNASIASFATGELYDHADARGFIRLYGLPLLVRALMKGGRAADKAAAMISNPEPDLPAAPEPAEPRAHGRRRQAGEAPKPRGRRRLAADGEAPKTRGRRRQAEEGEAPKPRGRRRQAEEGEAPKTRGRRRQAAEGEAPKTRGRRRLAADDAAPKTRRRRPAAEGEAPKTRRQSEVAVTPEFALESAVVGDERFIVEPANSEEENFVLETYIETKSPETPEEAEFQDESFSVGPVAVKEDPEEI